MSAASWLDMEDQDSAPQVAAAAIGPQARQECHRLSRLSCRPSELPASWTCKMRLVLLSGRQMLSGLKQDRNAIGSPGYPAVHQR